MTPQTARQEFAPSNPPRHRKGAATPQVPRRRPLWAKMGPVRTDARPGFTPQPGHAATAKSTNNISALAVFLIDDFCDIIRGSQRPAEYV